MGEESCGLVWADQRQRSDGPKPRNRPDRLPSLSGVSELFRLLDKDQNGIVQLSLAEVSDSRLEELLVDKTLKSLD